MPIINEMHPHGNRRTRRGRLSWRGEVGWRRKKTARGEYYGRKLDAFIGRVWFARG